jgi:hypothetical protein
MYKLESKKSQVAEKGKEKEKDSFTTSPNQLPLPPAYALHDTVVSNLTAALSNLNLETSTTPTPDQCIAHLKLLESFHQLRRGIALQDGLFGIKDEFVPSAATDRERAVTLSQIREKRWAVYVAKAAKRFEQWWEKCIELDAERLQREHIPSSFKDSPVCGPSLKFDRDNLPPLGESRSLSGVVPAVTNLYRCGHGVAFLPAES